MAPVPDLPTVMVACAGLAGMSPPSVLPISALPLILTGPYVAVSLPLFQNPSVDRIVKFCWQEYWTGSHPLICPAYIRPILDRAPLNGVEPAFLLAYSLL